MARNKHDLRLFLNGELVKTTKIRYEDGVDPQEELNKIADTFLNSENTITLLNIPEWNLLELDHEGSVFSYTKT